MDTILIGEYKDMDRADLRMIVFWIVFCDLLRR